MAPLPTGCRTRARRRKACSTFSAGSSMSTILQGAGNRVAGVEWGPSLAEVQVLPSHQSVANKAAWHQQQSQYKPS